MKAFLTVILAIGCAALLIVGQIHWKVKTQVSVAASEPNKKVETVSNQSVQTNVKTDKNTSKNINTYLAYSQNWPKQAQKTFKQSLLEHKSYKVLIVGSNAINSSNETWSSLVKQKMEESYGKGNLQVLIRTFDITSSQFINQKKYLKLIDEDADLVLFEPFTLNDNGEVDTESSLGNLSTFMDAYKEENPNVVFILQPPHPLYQARFYPKQVDSLKDYAHQNNIAYLDHWTAWPDPDSEEIKNYLLEDNSGPNEKGNKIWGDFVLHYLLKE